MNNCPYCGKQTDAKLEHCPHCGGPLQRKAPAALAALAASAKSEHCPSCSSPVQDGDIICVQCGTNLLTGQKIPAKQEAVAVERLAAGGSPNRWPVILAVGGGLLLLAVVIPLFLYYTKDPVASALESARQGNVLEGIDTLERRTSAEPEDFEAWITLGKLYWNIQKFGEAAHAFEEASKDEAQQVQAGFMTVLALNRMGGEGVRDRQIAALRRILERDRENMGALLLLGLSLGLAGDQVGQEEALGRLLQLNPVDVDAQLQLAVTSALEGEWKESEAQLLQLSQSSAAGRQPAAVLGLVSRAIGRNSDAAAHLEKALPTGTDIDNFAKTSLGLIYMSQGDFESALPLFREAKNNRPSPDSARFYYALCLAANGLGTEALAEFEPIASGTGPYAAQAATESAALFLAQGNVARTREFLSKAAQLGDLSPKRFTVEGQANVAEGQVTEARQSFRQALQADAAYAPAYLESGLLYVQQGVLSEGVRELERYVELAPRDAPQARVNEIELLASQLKQTLQ